MTEPWDQDDDHARADFAHMLERMRADYERATLEVATQALEGMPATSPVPMPDTAHPALERYAAGVRAWITVGRGVIRLPVVRSMIATYGDPGTDTLPISTLTLTPTRCVGLAPYIGDPRFEDARYCWTAMTDDHGRTITGPATLVIRPTIVSSHDDTMDPNPER